MAKRDCYEVLGVHRNASDAEIKKAFRRLALECHPDRHPDDPRAEARFKELAEAYEVLSDPARRADYDQFGHRENGPTGFGAGGADFGSPVDDLFQEIFGDIFGHRRRRGPRAERGADLRYNLTLEFEEAVFGCNRDLELPAQRPCTQCGGSGARPGTEPVSCPDCHGHGRVRFQQGFFAVERTCTRCRGTGRVARDACPGCRGTGSVRTRQQLEIRIPAGVETGSRLRIAGQGEAGANGGPAGDLYVVITVKDHEVFRRRGHDLVCDIPISFGQAVLGAEIEVPTLDGSARLRVPPGTQHGTVLTLKGKGIPRDGRRRGDQQVVIQIDVPTRVSPRQRELLEEFERLREEDGDTALGRLWEKIRTRFG